MEIIIRVGIEVVDQIEAHVSKANVSLQRPGQSDLVKRLVELFKLKSPTPIAAFHTGQDMADLKAARDAAHLLKLRIAQPLQRVSAPV